MQGLAFGAAFCLEPWCQGEVKLELPAVIFRDHTEKDLSMSEWSQSMEEMG